MIRIAAVSTAVVHLILMVVDWPGLAGGLLVGVTVAGTIVAALRRGSDGETHTWLPLALALELVALAYGLPDPLPAHAWRLLMVVVCLALLACLVVAVAARLRRLTRAVTATVVTAASVVLLLELVTTVRSIDQVDLHLRPALTRAMTTGPNGAVRPPADTTLRDTYRDDPRGYRRPVDLRRRTWTLEVIPGNRARLDFPPDDPGTVTVEIQESPATAEGWHLQVGYPRLGVARGMGYTLSFDIRAEAPRTLGVGFLQAHPPWETIGFYRPLEVAADEWTPVLEYFTASDSDDNVRVVFDLGGDPTSVTIRGLQIVDDEGREVLPPVGEDRFYVEYRFDADGCRISDAPARNDETGAELLVLGSDAALGTEVHVEDTFAALLAAGEGPDAPPSWRVRNCAVAGAGIAPDPDRYRGLTAGRTPAAVIVMLHPNDAWARDGGTRPGTVAGLFTLADHLPGRAPPDIGRERLVARLEALASATRADAVRLVVAFFRTTDDSRWEYLAAAVRDALASGDVTVIDLGTALADSLTWEVTHGDGYLSWPNEVAHRIAAAELRRLLSSDRPTPVE